MLDSPGAIGKVSRISGEQWGKMVVNGPNGDILANARRKEASRSPQATSGRFWTVGTQQFDDRPWHIEIVGSLFTSRI